MASNYEEIKPYLIEFVVEKGLYKEFIEFALKRLKGKNEKETIC